MISIIPVLNSVAYSPRKPTLSVSFPSPRLRFPIHKMWLPAGVPAAVAPCLILVTGGNVGQNTIRNPSRASAFKRFRKIAINVSAFS